MNKLNGDHLTPFVPLDVRSSQGLVQTTSIGKLRATSWPRGGDPACQHLVGQSVEVHPPYMSIPLQLSPGDVGLNSAVI